jgi:hypothetical protein
MTKRAASRNQRRFLPRSTQRERDLRLGRAALALPRILVICATAAFIAVAAVGFVSTAVTASDTFSADNITDE